MEKEISQYLRKHGFKKFCPKAVLFDMDGVIYDSMPNHAQSWHDAMADYQLDMPDNDAYQYEGMRGVETIKMLARQQWNTELSDEKAAEMYAHKSALFAACPPAQKMPGTEQLMQQIKDDGLKICVVTGSGQHTLLDKLLSDFEGLLDKELIVTAFDVKHGKPQPEPYLKGMKKCGTKPWETIVVENAPLGVRAAVAAQCFTIAVNTGPLPDKALLDEGADLIFPSMAVLGEKWNIIHQLFEYKGSDKKWEDHCQEITDYMNKFRRCPSKHRIEEHRMLNWIKYNKKVMAAGKMSERRLQKFEELLQLASHYHRINQYM